MTALCASPHCRPEKHGGPRRAITGSPLCERCDERAYEDWRMVVKLWPSTVHALVHHSPGVGEKVDGTPTYGLDLDETAIERRDKVLEDLRYWIHVLIDEERITQAPKHDDAAAMASVVATHVAHLTHHHDEHLAVCVAVDARKAARSCRWLSAPQRSRVYRSGIPCVEHTEDDMGQRVPCPGEYRAKLDDVVVEMPDLKCSENPEHTLTPSGFRGLGRQFHKAGAERLLHALGMGGKASA